MEAIRSARQFGMTMILLTLLFRLFETGPNFRSSIKTETGQTTVRSYSINWFPPFPYIPESSPPSDYAPVETKPVFSPEDAEGIVLVNLGPEAPDLGALISRPLEWCLTEKQPTVLILHTHTTESYTGDYVQSAAYRTLDEANNMLSIGDRVAELLEQEGIPVLHDRTLHDYPAYNSAYSHARRAMRETLKENPGIRLVLDLHRDAADSGEGQLRTQAVIRGKSGAQLMIVACCGGPGLSHPNWQENLALALKLQTVLEAQCPGIMRPISLRTQRFNQDLSAGALLVEVGAAGNTHAEAMLAAEQLACAIVTLKNGTAAVP